MAALRTGDHSLCGPLVLALRIREQLHTVPAEHFSVFV